MNIMVEHKHCLYDEAYPPMVHATFANDETMIMNVTAEPSAPYEDLLDSHNHHNNDDDTPRTTTTTHHQPDQQTTTVRDTPEHDRMVASGTAGAVIGLLVGGPFLAAIAGFGSAYATQKDGVAGDTTRALGEVALATKEKARELNHKHHIVDKSKQVAGEAWAKAQEMDQKHHILQQLKAVLIFSWGAFVDFVRRHRLMEKGVDGVGRALEYIAGKVYSRTGGTGTRSSIDENSASQTSR